MKDEVRLCIIRLLVILLCPTPKETKKKKKAKIITIKRVLRFVSNEKKNGRSKNTLKSGLFVLYYASHTVQKDSSKVFTQVPRIQIHANISENLLFSTREARLQTKNLLCVFASHAKHSGKDENLIHGLLNTNNHKQ